MKLMEIRKYVPILRSDATNSWVARCADCKQLLFMLTDEAVSDGPRRQSGSSAMLPVTMTVQHYC